MSSFDVPERTVGGTTVQGGAIVAEVQEQYASQPPELRRAEVPDPPAFADASWPDSQFVYVSNLWGDGSIGYPPSGGTGIWHIDQKFAKEELNKPDRPRPDNLSETENEGGNQGADLVERIAASKGSQRLRHMQQLRQMLEKLDPGARARMIDAINATLRDRSSNLKLAYVPLTGQTVIGGRGKDGIYHQGPVVYGHNMPVPGEGSEWY